MMSPKITAQHYYDMMPDGYHRPGDIWSGFPTHGLLGVQFANALVVTPACDLSQRKVDTLTYLPVLPVAQWLTTTAFVPEIVGQLKNVLQHERLRALCPELSRIPTSAQLVTLDQSIKMLGATIKDSERAIASALERARAGQRLLANSFSLRPAPASLDDLRILFTPKTWTSTMEKLVQNSLRLDVFFLPPDEQDQTWSAISEPAVALYRFPLTAPIDVLDAAEDLHSRPDWEIARAQLECLHPIARSFAHVRPMRRATLRERFLADLMTRYLSVYLRLGSPDFTAETINVYASMLGG